MGQEGLEIDSDMFGNRFIFDFGHKHLILNPQTHFWIQKVNIRVPRNQFWVLKAVYSDPTKSILDPKSFIFGSHEVNFGS